MAQTFEKMVSFRYFRSRKRERVISVSAAYSMIGIMIGVAALIVVMSVMNGFRDDLITRILGLNGHAMIYDNQTSNLQAYGGLLERVSNIDDVITVAPIVEGQALMTVAKGKISSGVIVKGMKLSDFLEKPILSSAIYQKLEKNRPINSNMVAIGKVMAERFHLKLGDKITLIAPKGKASPFGTIPRSRSYIVGSIFDVGMYEYNSSFIYMLLSDAQKFYSLGQGITALELMVKDPTNIDEVKSKIAEILPRYGAVIVDWRDNNSSFYTALKVERNVMFLILTLIIMVAAFNIISSMIMLVKEKGRDIAILRTMGATKSMIVRIFLYTGMAIGIIGTSLGAIIGIVIAINIESIRKWLEGLTGTELFADEIYFLSQLPSKLEISEVILIVSMALGLSFIATIYPAWKASKLDPVEALRNE